MQVNELKSARIELEHDLALTISAKLGEFQARTGVPVAEVELSFIDFTTVGGQRSLVVERVHVKLDV